MRPIDAEGHRVQQCGFIIGVGKDRQRVMGDGAIMAGAFHRSVECVMLANERYRLFQIAVANVAILEHTAPENPLLLTAAPV